MFWGEIIGGAVQGVLGAVSKTGQTAEATISRAELEAIRAAQAKKEENERKAKAMKTAIIASSIGLVVVFVLAYLYLKKNQN